ncbi:M16 family metallopeptidase [Dyella lipolytica]|uniref:Insulinase family protein n=1 Tax=Dyella lipolytica TaxID=1867835 RepID=A0ABW8ITS5_9GAMM|nr:pitrilysin family protein [Dyella lipolytica]
MISSRPLRTLAWSVMLGMGLLAAGVPARADAPSAVVAATDGKVLRATLDNGLRVVIVRETLSPMVTTQITYLAGGYQTPDGFPGTAHALEHMMFRDSQGMTGSQLNEMTGKMGADNNAFTTNDATQYYFVAPSNYLDILLHIESTRMEGALLTQKDWDRERGAIEQEVSRDISDPSFLAFQKAERVLYAGTGYAEDPLGTRPSFDKTTSEHLQSFYKDWYAPNNALLVIVGDVDPQQTLTKVRQLFGAIPKRTLPASVPVQLQAVKSQTIAATTPQGTGSVQFLYRMPGMMDKDNAAAQVLLDVLNNARSSLSGLAVQGKVLSADAQLQPFSRGGIGMIEVGFPKGGDATKAQADLEGVIADLLKNGAPADLVEASKRSEIAQAEFNKNSAVTLASAWSQAIAWMGLSSPEEAEEQIRNVTVDDVDRVAREYLKPDARVTVVLTSDNNGQRPPDSAGFGGSESFAGNDKLNAPLPSWAAEKLSKLEMPRWTLAPVQMTLNNGIHLIVQPENISKTVTVLGHIDNNPKLHEPAGQEGAARLLDTLFDYGSTTLDRDAFHKALDDISANENGGTDFGVAALSNQFDRAMQLLADNELHPALPQQGFTVQQDTLARSLAGEMQSPQYKMRKALMAGLLPAGDPDLRLATPDTIHALTLQNLKDYYAKTYRPDLTTIVVVGDIAPDVAKATVERYFGAWKAEGPKPDVISKPVAVNPAGYTVVENSYASQDQVLMGQMLDLNMHNPDRYALQLGNNVLGGNGFASRLMTDIRVKHGYAYGAGSGIRFDRSRSIFFVQYGSDPDKVGPVDGLVRQNLIDMQNTPIKEDELTNARQYEIRSIPVGVASINNIARSLLTWAWHDEPLDQPMVAAKHYLALTPAQVQAAFKKYLKPGNLTQVVQGPAPTKH